MKRQILFRRCQPVPRTTESQLNPKCRGDEDVDFPGFNFLQVARGYFCPFRQFILCHSFAHPFPAHISAENFDSLPFFLGKRHDILHRFLMVAMNDTYIVKCFLIPLARLDQDLGISCLRT